MERPIFVPYFQVLGNHVLASQGSWVDVWKRLDRPEGRGSRRNVIMCAGAILNAKYERQRAEWRLVTPLIDGATGRPIHG